jgi:hypothetical protein
MSDTGPLMSAMQMPVDIVSGTKRGVQRGFRGAEVKAAGALSNLGHHAPATGFPHALL